MQEAKNFQCATRKLLRMTTLNMAILLAAGCSIQVNNPQVASGNSATIKGKAELDVRNSGQITTVVNASNASTPAATPTSGLPAPASPSPGRPTATPSVPDAPAPIASSPSAASDGRFHAPVFVSVRAYSDAAVYEVLDFNRVIVADGTKLEITKDAGQSWGTYTLPGAVRNMSWTDGSHGWCVTTGHSLFKLEITDSGLVSSAVDPGKGAAVAVCFTSPDVGFLAAGANTIARTVDGGKTWTAIATVLMLNNASTFVKGSSGQVAYVDHGNPGQIYGYADGGFAQVPVRGGTSLTNVVFGGSTAILSGLQNWPYASTTDWSTLTPIGRNITTPTQILQNAVAAIYPISDTTWLATIWLSGALSISRDAGKSWSDPTPEKLGNLAWISPFDENHMWALRETNLLRAGRP